MVSSVESRGKEGLQKTPGSNAPARKEGQHINQIIQYHSWIMAGSR